MTEESLHRHSQTVFSSGFLLFLGIVLEDVPQIVITFLVESRTEAMEGGGGGSSSGLAVANFLTSLYNGLIKLADAYDLRADVLATGGGLLRTFKDHAGTVCSVSDLGRGRFVSASADATIRVWDWTTGECVRTIEAGAADEREPLPPGTSRVQPPGCPEGLFTVSFVAAFGDDGALSVSHNEISLWDLSTGTCRRTFLHGESRTENTFVSALVVVDDNTFVSSGGWAKTVRMWDVNSGECRVEFAGHESAMMTALAALRTNVILSGFGNGTVKLWSWKESQVDTIQCVHENVYAHSNTVGAVACIGEEKYVTAAYDALIKIWSMSDQSCLLSLAGHRVLVNDVTCFTSGKTSYVVSGAGDNTVKVWNASTGKCLRTFRGHSDSVASVSQVIAKDARNDEEVSVCFGYMYLCASRVG